MSCIPDPKRSSAINFVDVNGRSLYIVDWRVVMVEGGGGGLTGRKNVRREYVQGNIRISPLTFTHSLGGSSRKRTTQFVLVLVVRNCGPKCNTMTRNQSNQYASPLEGNAIPAGPVSDFWSDFYKIRRGGECPRSVPSRRTSRLWL